MGWIHTRNFPARARFILQFVRVKTGHCRASIQKALEVNDCVGVEELVDSGKACANSKACSAVLLGASPLAESRNGRELVFRSPILVMNPPQMSTVAADAIGLSIYQCTGPWTRILMLRACHSVQP